MVGIRIIGNRLLLWRAFAVAAVAAAVGYAPSGILDTKSVADLKTLDASMQDYKRQVSAISVENRRLEREIEALIADPVFLEFVARDQLGFVRKNDMVFYLGKADREGR